MQIANDIIQSVVKNPKLFSFSEPKPMSRRESDSGRHRSKFDRDPRYHIFFSHALCSIFMSMMFQIDIVWIQSFHVLLCILVFYFCFFCYFGNAEVVSVR